MVVGAFFEGVAWQLLPPKFRDWKREAGQKIITQEEKKMKRF